MSKKIMNDQSADQPVPFFAHLLSAQDQGGGNPAPTYHCLDSECTKKYPSDGDEPTSPTWDK